MVRSITETLPTFSAELAEVREHGITKELLQKIIQKHRANSLYNYKLYERYMAVAEGVDIFDREPRFEEEKPINNKVNNDFMGEIVDFKVGYFAGKPIGYSYSTTDEAEETTGGEEAVDKASKAITDFTTRNNMFGVDMETTKFASIYGYAGRLFYIEADTGDERVIPIHGYETIILSDTDISEPECAVRYYKETDINGVESWTADFYDKQYKYTFKGDLLSLEPDGEPKEHCFDFCPLQGVANNKECMGDAERVIALIDAYDKTVSDNANEIESFAHAYMVFRQLIDEPEMQKAQKTGSFYVPNVGNSDKDPIYWLTKNVNDGYTEHHLDRLEDNIYRFSRTPNLGDESWGNASGVSLKFKLHGLEVKCAQFQAKMMDANKYMWKLLASAWSKKGIHVDPLQCVCEFKRNFPLDEEGEARTVQACISAGLPKKYAFSKMSDIDDVDWIMQLLQQEKEDATSLFEEVERDNADKAIDEIDDEEDVKKDPNEQPKKSNGNQ